ncbi:DUF2264 domain-containing protein [Marinobacterium aestuariivivens]|uniref:DUF2264 domain-containing protein n=1 Tax=Marinobacterium aestuariivivens TaxID=1698799 RepID=A0ABW1ZV06_9GAMM
MIHRRDLAMIARMHKQLWHRKLYGKAPYRSRDDLLKSRFAGPADHPCQRFAVLMHYFWDAHRHYLHSTGTLAYYPGAGSIYGARNDGIEGVTRLLPLWAACRNAPCSMPSLREAMDAHIRRALVNGTDPEHPGYWGDIGHRSTLICEAADIALTVWLIRDSLWHQFGDSERQRILNWLQQVIDKQTADNNWHLFVILVDKVIEALVPSHRFASASRYQRVRSFYRGNGCFVDGEDGAVDLYNAWAFHYALYWLDKIDRQFDPRFIHDAIQQFSAWYQYLFTDSGVVLFGRSLCYRMATPVPLLIAAELNPREFSAGMALAALDNCWRYFILQGGVCLGRPTQGVFGDDQTWLDPYSGPASSFWSTRSLVVFYHQSLSTDWSRIHPIPLPAQERQVEIQVSEAGLRLATFPDKGFSQVIFYDHLYAREDIALKHQTLRDKVRQWAYGVAYRPSNNLLKQGLREFDSRLDAYRRDRP